jgi:hypothetical protein
MESVREGARNFQILSLFLGILYSYSIVCTLIKVVKYFTAVISVFAMVTA